MNTLSETEFQAIRRLIYERSGINLTHEKKTLIVSRLQNNLRRYGHQCFGDYYAMLVNDSSGRTVSELIDCISTNHTYFGRETDHFDFFSKTALPEAATRRSRQRQPGLRIWCAACSSGEEAYTLVMLMMEYFKESYANRDAGVLATDISARILETARRGAYPPDRVAQLSPALRHQYFVSCGDDRLTVIDRVKREVTFRRFNLTNRQFPFKEPFDIIFCRNVMIYFDAETRGRLIEQFYQWLVPGGYLFIGMSESIPRNQRFFHYIRPAVYQRTTS